MPCMHAKFLTAHLCYICISGNLLFVIYRKFFHTRHSIIGRDPIDIDKFKLVQLQRRVQRDSYNCGVLCLKVCMYAYWYIYIHIYVMYS